MTPYWAGYQGLRRQLLRFRREHDVVEVCELQTTHGPAHAATSVGGLSACGTITVGYLTSSPWPPLGETCPDCIDLVPPDLDETDVHVYLDYADREFPERS